MAFDDEIRRGVNKIGDAARGLIDIQVPAELDGLTTYADCFRNIDDILIDRLQGLLYNYLQRIVDNIFLYFSTLPIIQGIEAQLGKVLGEINRLAGKPFVQTAIRLYNARSDAERIAILAEFTGARAAIDNFLGQIPGLANLCGISTVPGVPPIGKIDYEPLPPPPPLVPPMELNKELDETIGEYTDMMGEVNDALNKESLPNEPGYMSMITCLTGMVITYIDMIKYGNGEATTLYQQAIQYNVIKFTDIWGEGATDQFISRANDILGIIDVSVVSRFGQSRRRSEPVNSIVVRGATAYGPGNIDLTTYLELTPAARAQWGPEVAAYMDSFKGGIAGQERGMQQSGNKTGFMPWDWQYSGPYGRTLIPGVSVASTRFPGNTILRATYSDGTPYVVPGLKEEDKPAGWFPGYFRVDDTGSIGDPKKPNKNNGTYLNVDMFTDDVNDYEHIKKNKEGLIFQVIQLGNETDAKQYKRAQEIWNSTPKY